MPRPSYLPPPLADDASDGPRGTAIVSEDAGPTPNSTADSRAAERERQQLENRLREMESRMASLTTAFEEANTRHRQEIRARDAELQYRSARIAALEASAATP